MALSEAESEDDSRYEEIVEREGVGVERLSEKDILVDIRKRLSEVYYMIHKIRNQEKRKESWNLYGPPSRIREEFEEIHNTENAEPQN